MDRYSDQGQAPLEIPQLDQTDLSLQPPVVRRYLLKLDPVAQKLANETIRQNDALKYRAIVIHRKSLLRLNTACACTICPVPPFERSPSPFGPDQP